MYNPSTLFSYQHPNVDGCGWEYRKLRNEKSPIIESHSRDHCICHDSSLECITWDWTKLPTYQTGIFGSATGSPLLQSGCITEVTSYNVAVSPR